MKMEIRIEPADGEGFAGATVHHSAPTMGEQSQSHVFGKNEGHDMLAHLANHMEIPETEEKGKLSPEDASKIRENAR